MKYFLSILMILLLASTALAQTELQGPSKLNIRTYEKSTNTGPAVESAAPTLPQGPSPLITGGYGEAPAAEPKSGLMAPASPQDPIPLVTGGFKAPTPALTPVPAQDAAIEQARLAKVSFLMDTGVQYANEGEYKEAEQAYLRALQADPGNPDLFFRLSTLYIQMERFEDAAILLNKLVDAFPENPMLQNNLSWIYATGGKMKNSKLALRHAREAILITPFAASLWNTLAEAYYVSGLYNQALRSSEFAIELLRSQQQKPSDEELRSFELQHMKIQRAAESYKTFMGLDDKK
jgi:tetratricopeptide (TPR) repeat protein